MKASDLFVKALENEGVEYIFGIPGEENLDILDSLRNSSIELILTRHEQGAGFMAATYGRLTGKPWVCMSNLGPGTTNLVTLAAYALNTIKRLNTIAFRVNWMPFGGRDSTGIGMGRIQYSINEMTHEKLMVIKSPML